MTARTTQETAAEVLSAAWRRWLEGAGAEPDTIPDEMASLLLDALAAAGWSVVRVQQFGWASDDAGAFVHDNMPGHTSHDRCVPLYRVTAGEVAPGD